MTEGLKGLERSSTEFQKADWFGMILDLLLVKNFLPELYEEIREKQNFGEFEKVYKGYTQRFFWDCVCDSTRSHFGMKKGKLC